MKLIKNVIILLIILMFNIVSFAQVKIFVKEGESVVQKDQSVNQVIAYLKQKLTREAQEEAGTFITTNLKIENYQIKKDEFTSFAGSISKTTVLEEKSFMKNTEQYVKVKIKSNIDIDNVKAYLEKIMRDNEYKEKAKKALEETEQLRKEKLELENKLRTATKQEYEQKLSLQAEQLVEVQKQREIELNKMAIQAKEEYTKIEKQQKQKELERQKKLNAFQQKIEQEQLEMQQKIEQEKDNIKRAELENQAKIKELENIASQEKLTLNINATKNKISIQQVIEDTKKIKENIKNIKDNFSRLSKKNTDNLEKSYDKQIEILNKSEFKKEEPKKDLFETTEEFNFRLQKYNLEKNTFYKKRTEKINSLINNKKIAIIEDENKTLKSMYETLKPFVNKLMQYQKNYYHDENNNKIKILPINEVYIDEYCFPLTILYDNQKYNLIYYFNDIDIEKIKLMYKTQNQFIIKPLFSVEEQNNDVKQVLVAFKVKHLGTRIEKILWLYKYINDFPEIKEFEYLIKQNDETYNNIAILKK